MKPGDMLETAIWMTGEEPEGLKGRFERDLRKTLVDMAATEKMIIGPLVMTEKRPGEDRVPEVPKDVHGPDVRLLVGEAQVVCRQPFIALPGSFVADLDRRDLSRLREITRRASPCPLSDPECDGIIEEIGPNSALAELRANVTLH